MARPALAALNEQQQTIDAQNRTLGALSRTAQRQRATILKQAGQIEMLARGIEALANALGPDFVSRVTVAMHRHADVQNPAQPVPEPPAEPAPHTTQEAKTPEAFADVTAPGLVPGSTQDVAADVTSTVYTPGQDVPSPAVKQLVDVTRPVDGTQGPQPLGDVKTLTDVRVGDPMNPQTAFPLRGDFAQAQRTAAADPSRRTMASLRLARLRIEAGTAENTDEFVETALIEKSASTTEQIENEISTLDGVKTAAHRRVAARNPSLVPRTAGMAPRSTPSMQGTPITAAINGSGASVEQVADDALFD